MPIDKLALMIAVAIVLGGVTVWAVAMILGAVALTLTGLAMLTIPALLAVVVVRYLSTPRAPR